MFSLSIQVGYAVTTYHQEDDSAHQGSDHTPSTTPVIGFDMGGTSTDVSRYAGEYEHVFESNMAGVCIQAPQVGGWSLVVLPWQYDKSISLCGVGRVKYVYHCKNFSITDRQVDFLVAYLLVLHSCGKGSLT